MIVFPTSYSKAPYRFINREYFIITYISDEQSIRKALPLEPDGSNKVLYEFINMPGSAGLGKYKESGIVIPAKYNEQKVNFTAQMYLDNDAAISVGREIWGFPKKYANPALKIVQDTLTGTLEYGDQRIVIGTMGYKYNELIGNKNGQYNIEEFNKYNFYKAGKFEDYTKC